MHNDYDILLHRQKHRHNDERGRLQRDDIGCRQNAGESDGGEAGAVGGSGIRGVQLAGHCKHAVGVCDDEDKAGRADDGAAGAAGRGDIRGVQFAGHCKHDVGSFVTPFFGGKKINDILDVHELHLLHMYIYIYIYIY